MMNDGSLGSSVASSVFDLNSQKGVAILLASIRASSISPAQKNEIRDLVFQYMSGDMDHTIRISLEQKLVSLNITAVTPPSSSVERKQMPKYPFGTSRPAPSFPVSNLTTPKKPAPTIKAVSTTPTTPTTPITPTPPAPPDPLPNPQELIIPTLEPALSQKDVSDESLRDSMPDPSTIPVIQQVQTTVEPTSAPEPLIDPTQGLQRIKEIKSLVNERIGNPVNLVDINNEVGREYMSAMLDAMKKLNTGSSAVSAMKRLEDAYVMVEKTLSEYKDHPVQHEAVLSVTQVPTPQTSPSEPVEENGQVPESLPKTINTYVPEVTTDSPSDQESSFDDVVSEVPDSEVDNNEVQTTTLKSQWSTEELGKSPEVISSVEMEESTWIPQSETPSVTDGRAHSLAEAKIKLKRLDDLPLSSAIETSSVSGDPLYTKEVDDGLQHLLSEWPIFKKSGFFGTGPKGREHPLFIKVASLQIPLLLAGRFEGATQEIKQSITDYMNGWRYEQGIIYEHGETFEHYLRRVIRHIIDLQKRRRPS